MDSADSDDILEIAAYGTQVTCIKKEVEDPACIEKETAIDKDHAEILNSRSYKLLVYTTRLDQMNAFNELGMHTSAEATEQILAESKPRYKQIQIKAEPPCDPYFSSYIKLCSQVHQLNTIVKHETNLRNEKLMNICKPLKIDLKDYATRIPQLKKEFEDITFSNYLSDEYEPSSYSSEDDAPLSKTALCSRVSKTETRKVLPVIITVAIKDKRSQEADVYIIDASEGVRNYYRTNMDKCYKLQKLHQSKKIKILEYCCWVNREKLIKKVITLAFTKACVSQFLRKPHNCLPRPCSCCCVLGTPILKQSSEDEFDNESKNKKYIMLSIPVSNNNIIEKANNYIPKIHDIPTTNDEPAIFLKRAVIIIKYHCIIFAQTNILGENYEVGKKGEIIDYTRPTVNRSITEEVQLCQNFETIKKRVYLSYLICCWHNREDVITQLQLTPSALRYIKSPHLCRSDKCECCCKPNPLINFALGSIALHNNPSLYSKKPSKALANNEDKMKKQTIDIVTYIYKTPIRRGNMNEDENIEIQNAKTVKNIINRKANTRAPQKVNNVPSKPKTLKKQSTVQENSDLTTGSCFEQNPTPTNPITVTTNTQFQLNVNNTINPSNETFVDPTNSPNITGILDKFKNLKLSVNENGKLTAIINTLPGKMSTAEMKVLSDILLLASTQIEQIGITAQEFCNRVNASKPADGSISSPLPRLVPIFSNAINKTVINDSRVAENDASKLPTSLQDDIQSRPLHSVCNTHPLNSSVPITRNKTPVCSIYQMMSTIGAQKNQYLVNAYRLHFREMADEDAMRNKKKRPVLKTTEFLPKIGEVYSLKDYDLKTVKSGVYAPVAKRKIWLTAKPAPMKLRETPVESLPKHLQSRDQSSQNVGSDFMNTIDKNISDKVNATSVIVTERNQIPCLIHSSGVMPASNTNATIVPQPANQIPLFVTNSIIAPIENASGNFVPPIFASNSKVIPVQNACDIDPLLPIMEASDIVTSTNFIPVQNLKSGIFSQSKIGTNYNQIPIFIPNTNFIPTQNKCNTDPLQITMEDVNQTPLFVTNNNFMPVQNTTGTHVSQSIIVEHNQIPIYIPNYNFILVQKTGVTDFPQPKVGADHKEIPLVDASIASNRIIPAQNPIATDLLQPTMEIHNNEPPVILTDSTASQTPNTNSTNLPEPEIKTDEQTRSSVTNSSVTIQDTIDAVVSNAHLVERTPAGPAPSDNPLLYQMLSKVSSSPRQFKPLHHSPRQRPNSSTISVQPLIRAHSGSQVPIGRSRKRPRNNDTSSVPECNIVHVKRIHSNDSDEMDTETSFTTNVIEAVNPAEFSQDEILNAVNNKQLIEDDEEDGIFGV